PSSCSSPRARPATPRPSSRPGSSTGTMSPSRPPTSSRCRAWRPWPPGRSPTASPSTPSSRAWPPAAAATPPPSSTPPPPAPGSRLISYYGAAEIGFIGDSRDGDGTWIHVYPTIGAQIRDESGAEVAEGELGTLWIDAAACSDGYVAGTTDAVLRGPDGWASVD